MTTTARLKLLALDADDLGVISAALQDAVAHVGDIRFEPQARRLTVAFNRFRWEGLKGERVRAGLQFGGVLSCQARHLKREPAEAVVELLAIGFEPAGEGDPGGTVVLHFAGDADLRLAVECIDAALADVSDPWPTRRTPGHT
ncbi:MAG TPA: DUF2948 family protein [Caulobacteraceae bacterium]|jgi:hypothetical protein|nr:DUF2948 family protein [Caulobacteraceae bacterium]